jgi:hypothetical protein
MEIIREHRPARAVLALSIWAALRPDDRYHVEKEADITVGVVEVPRERAGVGVVTVDMETRVLRSKSRPIRSGAGGPT